MRSFKVDYTLIVEYDATVLLPIGASEKAVHFEARAKAADSEKTYCCAMSCIEKSVLAIRFASVTAQAVLLFPENCCLRP